MANFSKAYPNRHATTAIVAYSLEDSCCPISHAHRHMSLVLRAKVRSPLSDAMRFESESPRSSEFWWNKSTCGLPNCLSHF